jgi:tetratricopeptide (TPR) repeat protein
LRIYQRIRLREVSTHIAKTTQFSIIKEWGVMMKKQAVKWLSINLLALMPFAPFANASTPQKLSQFPEGERLVYGRFLEAYHHTQWQEMLKERNILERNYPSSVHLDNAYYLTGMVEFQQNRLGEALKSFSTVRERFEKSNKRPSALFAMGVTYNKLGLAPLQQKVFNQLIREYPGSMESQRAWMQLRVDKETMKSKAHKS